MLKVSELEVSYKRNTKKVFQNFSVQFAKGFNVILGPNGAGKSTLMKSLFGLLDCKGDIFYGNDDLKNMDFNQKIEWMSYLPQMDIDTSSLTVMEMVLLGKLPDLKSKVSQKDLDDVMKVLKDLNIENLAFRMFYQLSGGQQKLVFIAQTLVRNPKIILLDEPTNSLDLQKQLELCHLLKKLVKEKGIDVIAILHDLNIAARYADFIVVISSEGEVYHSGKASEVITEKMLKEVYGVTGEILFDRENIPMVFAKKSIRDEEM